MQNPRTFTPCCKSKEELELATIETAAAIFDLKCSSLPRVAGGNGAALALFEASPGTRGTAPTGRSLFDRRGRGPHFSFSISTTGRFTSSNERLFSLDN
jgi:hypothetical protein